MEIVHTTPGAERSLSLGVITRTDIVKFAGAGGDFNPMHHDDVYARAAGNPSVFAMGMLTASLASRLITDWFGLDALRSFSVRFIGLVWPDESLTVEGRIAERVEEASEVRLRIDVKVANDAGVPKMTATAWVVDSQTQRKDHVR